MSNMQAVATQALRNAVSGQSFGNYQAIFEGFAAMGIAAEDIKPRENVFTFNAWRALGRTVSKGQKGVRVVTVIRCTRQDAETGESHPVRKPRTTAVFHISQTEALS
jgi:hypothetical protein